MWQAGGVVDSHRTQVGGELEAEANTIAFASRGANVVANGGKVGYNPNPHPNPNPNPSPNLFPTRTKVVLRGSEIKGALGDGVSSWNNAHLRLPF